MSAPNPIPRQGITTQKGIIAYRTPLLTLQQAGLVACGMEQLPGICGVEIIPSKSKGSGWVQWTPSDEKEREQMYLDLMHRQVEKAVAEMGQYQFFPTGDGGCAIFTLPKKDGSREMYLVKSDFSCPCPDYAYRCSACGLYCKHGIAWKIQRAKTGDSPVIEGAVVGGQEEESISPTRQPNISPLPAAEFYRKAAIDFG